MTRPTALIPADAFTSLPWWKKLSPDEQTLVKSELRGLADAAYSHGQSKLAMGEHLVKLREVLEPHRLFVRFLKNFKFSKRTAFRYIAGYQNFREQLPEHVQRAVLARGYDMMGDSEKKPLGIYTDAVKALPPPRRDDPVKIDAWLKQVDEKVKDHRKRSMGRRSRRLDPDDLLKTCFRIVDRYARRLPNDERVRIDWARQLAGMILNEIGVTEKQTIAPVELPEGFKAIRGRPRKTGPEEVA